MGTVDAKVISETAMMVKKDIGILTFIVETGYPTGPKFLGCNEQNQAKYVPSACEQAFTCDAINRLGGFDFRTVIGAPFPFMRTILGYSQNKTAQSLGGWNMRTRSNRSADESKSKMMRLGK